MQTQLNACFTSENIVQNFSQLWGITFGIYCWSVTNDKWNFSMLKSCASAKTVSGKSEKDPKENAQVSQCYRQTVQYSLGERINFSLFKQRCPGYTQTLPSIWAGLGLPWKLSQVRVMLLAALHLEHSPEQASKGGMRKCNPWKLLWCPTSF